MTKIQQDYSKNQTCLEKKLKIFIKIKILRKNLNKNSTGVQQKLCLTKIQQGCNKNQTCLEKIKYRYLKIKINF